MAFIANTYPTEGEPMRKVLFSVFISASLLCTTAFASVNDDQVTSQKIKEADGTTGQATNSGSGVKTGHIQNGAVTSDKIQDGAVDTADLANGAVSDAKITGPISASKISSIGLDADTVDGKHAADLAPVVHAHAQSDVTGLGAELADKAALNHNHDGVYQKKYSNVVVVAKSGGDFTDPVAAMNSITDASSANPYLLKIMPGVYSIGSSVVQMKPYVDIEGSGEAVTTITGNTSNAYPQVDAAVVMGADNAELRSLTVENAGPGTSNMSIGILNLAVSPRISNVTVVSKNGAYWSVGVWNGGVGSPVITNCRISALDGGHTSQAVIGDADVTIRDSAIVAYAPAGSEVYAIYLGGPGSQRISDSTLTVTGGSVRSFGIHNAWDNTLQLTNVTVSAADANGQAIWGIGSGSALITVDRCTLEGGQYSISIGGYIVKVGASKVIGAVSGNVACFGDYDGNMNPLNSGCQP